MLYSQVLTSSGAHRGVGCAIGRRCFVIVSHIFFFQAEDGIRDLVRSRGLGDVYKRQIQGGPLMHVIAAKAVAFKEALAPEFKVYQQQVVDLSLIHI